MENKFKKGLILGGLLAVAAGVGLAMSNSGQKLTEELQKDLKDLAKHLKKNLHKLDDVTKENFEDMVTKLVDEYAKKKELATDIKETLTKELLAKWHEMEAEYQALKDDEDDEKQL